MQTSEGRVAAVSSYSQIAVERLCANSVDGIGQCRLTLLCTRCGVNPTLRMRGVSRRGCGAKDDQTMGAELQFKTLQGASHLLMPAVIVFDAVSVLRASQTEAVMPGAGLSSALRPLQGPICDQCCNISKITPQSKALDTEMGHEADDEADTIDPWLSSSSVSSDFMERHGQLIENLRWLDISPHGSIQGASSASGYKSQDAPSETLGTMMQTKCECGDATGYTCVNRHKIRVAKHHSTPTENNLMDTASIVFGHVSSDVNIDVVEDPSTDIVYEMCIVDTRRQLLCRLSETGEFKSGLLGQHNYTDPAGTCAIAATAVSAMKAHDQCFHTPSTTVTTVHMDDAVLPMASSATYVPVGIGIPMSLVAPRKTSCVVCCSLLDDEYRLRHMNVYLPAHKNWAHRDCTVECEQRIPGVCIGLCPRLNTFVSTIFDGSPRFQNVCAACAFPNQWPSLTEFKLPSITTSSMSTRFSTPHRMDNMSNSPTSYQTKSSIHKPSSKSPVNSTNWLSGAAALRRRACLNLAESKLTAKQLKDRAATSFQYPEDKSGIFQSREHATWYNLDRQGLNPGPVCGLPFYDPVFGEVRIWETLDERGKALAEHEIASRMENMCAGTE
jgi:hypothetical protein